MNTYQMQPFNVLVADPPWDCKERRGLPALKLYEIQRHPLPPIADRSLLVLWRVGSMVKEAYAVISAWGFTPKSEIVWIQTGPRTGDIDIEKDVPSDTVYTCHLSPGHYVRNAHEIAIVAARGAFDVHDTCVRSLLFAPIGAPQERPDGFYDLVERLGTPATARYAEIFGRKARAGWHVFGSELPGGYVWSPRPIPGPGRTDDDDSAWAAAARRAEEQADENEEPEEELAEIPLLPRHKIRRADGSHIVPACCVECGLPQYVSFYGVVCANNHVGAASIPGCDACGKASCRRATRPASECESVAVASGDPDPSLNGFKAASDGDVRDLPSPVEPSVPIETAPPPPPTPPPPAPSPPPPPAAIAAAPERVQLPHPPDQKPAPYVPENKRNELLARAKAEGIISQSDIAEGAEAAWIKLLFRAPSNWFPPAAEWVANGSPATPAAIASRVQPGEKPFGETVRDLNARGYYVTIIEFGKWSITKRDVVRSWLDQGGDPPEWLAVYSKAPAHAAKCASGCIGAEAGCPAAIHAWAQIMPPEIAEAPAEKVALTDPARAERARAPTIPAPAAPAPKAANASRAVAIPPKPQILVPLKRGRGRPPGAKNKKTISDNEDAWAAARLATTQSEDPETEEGFFS